MMAQGAVSATETALENQRIGPLQIRVVALCTLIQICDAYDVNAIAVTVPSLTHAWHLRGGGHRAALDPADPLGLAAGIAALPCCQGQIVAARRRAAAAPRHHPGAGSRPRPRPRPRQPDQDAVRRGLCAADRAVMGDLFLQPVEPVSLRLLAAPGA